MAGDIPAADFDELMRLHSRQVLGLALRLTGNLADAQDAAQEVFLRLHRYLAKLPDAEAVGPWLHRVTANVCFDMKRRRRVLQTMPVTGLVLAAAEPGADTVLAARQDQERLTAALNQLGERERAALVLRELEGLSTAEVAEVLGSAESTIRVQIVKARLKLRSLLKGLR